MNAARPDDASLSGFDRKLWGLTYETLIRFGCPITFRKTGPDVPRKLNLHLEFMIPRDNQHAAEASAFIRNELASELRPPMARTAADWHWGVDLRISWCHGIPGYLDRAVAEKMARNAADNLQEFLRSPKPGREEIARRVAHAHCSHCTGGTGYGSGGDGPRYHSKACDDLTHEILGAFDQLRLHSIAAATDVPADAEKSASQPKPH